MGFKQGNFAAGTHDGGFRGTLEHGAREFESQAVSRRFTPYKNTGDYGVTYMRPTNEQGIPLAKDAQEGYEYIHNNRSYKLNQNGCLKFFEPQAFTPTIKANLEHENYLSKLSVYLLGGDKIMQNIFGADILGHCKPVPDADQICNGLLIPKGLAKEDCTPSVLRLYDPSMKEWIRGSAKLRAIISTYPVIALSDLPDWNMSFTDAGEKGMLEDVREANAKGAAPAEAPTAPLASGSEKTQ